jgi:hypothetical protein
LSDKVAEVGEAVAQLQISQTSEEAYLSIYILACVVTDATSRPYEQTKIVIRLSAGCLALIHHPTTLQHARNTSHRPESGLLKGPTWKSGREHGIHCFGSMESVSLLYSCGNMSTWTKSNSWLWKDHLEVDIYLLMLIACSAANENKLDYC